MSTAPRYWAHEIGGHVLPFGVCERPRYTADAPVFLARCATKEAADTIADALNAPTKAVSEVLTAAMMDRAASTIGKAIAAALMTKPTNPSMDAGGEHIEAATAGPAPAPEPAVSHSGCGSWQAA